MIQKLIGNFMQDHVAAPTGVGILAVMNDGLKMGLDFKTLVLVAAVSCVFAAIQAWHDIAERKLPKPPTT